MEEPFPKILLVHASASLLGYDYNTNIAAFCLWLLQIDWWLPKSYQ